MYASPIESPKFPVTPLSLLDAVHSQPEIEAHFVGLAGLVDPHFRDRHHIELAERETALAVLGNEQMWRPRPDMDPRHRYAPGGTTINPTLTGKDYADAEFGFERYRAYLAHTGDPKRDWYVAESEVARRLQQVLSALGNVDITDPQAVLRLHPLPEDILDAAYDRGIFPDMYGIAMKAFPDNDPADGVHYVAQFVLHNVALWDSIGRLHQNGNADDPFRFLRVNERDGNPVLTARAYVTTFRQAEGKMAREMTTRDPIQAWGQMQSELAFRVRSCAATGIFRY